MANACRIRDVKLCFTCLRKLIYSIRPTACVQNVRPRHTGYTRIFELCTPLVNACICVSNALCINVPHVFVGAAAANYCNDVRYNYDDSNTRGKTCKIKIILYIIPLMWMNRPSLVHSAWGSRISGPSLTLSRRRPEISHAFEST